MAFDPDAYLAAFKPSGAEPSVPVNQTTTGIPGGPADMVSQTGGNPTAQSRNNQDMIDLQAQIKRGGNPIQMAAWRDAEKLIQSRAGGSGGAPFTEKSGFDPDAYLASFKKPAVPTDVRTPTPQAAPRPQSQAPDWADMVAGSIPVRAAVGVASPIIGAFQAGANVGDWLAEKMGNEPVVGKWVADKLKSFEEMKQRGMGGPGAWDIAGGVGALASGGVAVSRLPQMTSMATRIAQGVAAGAGMGAATPSTVAGIEETGKNALIGGAAGGAITGIAPMAASVGQKVYRVGIEPWFNPSAIKGRAYMDAAGDKADDIINALRSTKEIVPGSKPTAGQAAADVGRAEFSAMQESARKIAPSKYVARDDVANKARVTEIEKVSGTEATQVSAKATRKANAGVNYPAAYAEGVDADMAAMLKPQIKSIMSRDSIKQARKDAIGMAREQDKRFSDLGDAEGLDLVRRALSKQIGAEKDPNAQRILIQTRDDLTKVLEDIAPKLGEARAAFKADSAPINQAEVGQYLKDKLVPALNEDAAQKATSFAGAVRDAPGTVKRALTDAPRYQKLSDVLTPAQVKSVESIREDLAREARDKYLAQKGREAGPQAGATVSTSIHEATGGGKIPNPLSRVVTVANAILDRLEGKIDRKLAIEIADEMLNPKKVADVMEKSIKRGQKVGKIKDVANKLAGPGVYAGQVTNNLTQD